MSERRLRVELPRRREADEESAALEPRRSSGAPARPRGSPCPQQPPRRGARMGPGAQTAPWTATSSLRASPRRVFTRLNCSLIMRGLGRSTWEVWGWLGKKRKKPKHQNKNTNKKNPKASPSGAASLGTAGFFLPTRNQKTSGAKGDGCAAQGGTAERSPEPQAGMSCRGSLRSPGTLCTRGTG